MRLFVNSWPPGIVPVPDPVLETRTLWNSPDHHTHCEIPGGFRYNDPRKSQTHDYGSTDYGPHSVWTCPVCGQKWTFEQSGLASHMDNVWKWHKLNWYFKLWRMFGHKGMIPPDLPECSKCSKPVSIAGNDLCEDCGK